MIHTGKDSIVKIITHQVGNKFYNEKLYLSKSELHIHEQLSDLLIKYFIPPFNKNEGFYHFTHTNELTFNEVYNYVSDIFRNPEHFYEQSVNIAKHLYAQSTHPKIKNGEFYVVYFRDCIVNGKSYDAVGLFKSENKETYLKVYRKGESLEIESEQGINTNKLDKGCLIFNTEYEEGYLVAVVDNTNKGADAKYWTDDFLKIRPHKNEFSQTHDLFSMCKDFITELPQEHDKLDKAIMINKSMKALQEDSVSVEQFAEDVFKTPELVDKFKRYKKNYEETKDISIDDTFHTDPLALRHKGTGKMTTIKLDRHFDIAIHGGEEFIERGYDEKRGMYYYKLFFKKEK